MQALPISEEKFVFFSTIFSLRISVLLHVFLLCGTLDLVCVMGARISLDVGIIHFVIEKYYVPKFQLTYINFNLILTLIAPNFPATNIEIRGKFCFL